MKDAGWSRRAAFAGLGILPVLGRAAWAQEAETAGDVAPTPLPLRVTRLEHVGTVVPDVTAAATFHSRLFNPAIRTEQQPVPLRLYVDLNGGYLAFGSRQGETRAFIDHFCALIADYDPDAVAARLREEGIDVAANWAQFGLFQDPDAIGVQLVADPGGWFPTVIDAEPLVQGPPLLNPAGLDHIMLGVSDMDASRAFYGKYFGPQAEEDEQGFVWFDLGAGTRLGLTPASPAPGVEHLAIRVAPFNREAIADALRGMGGTVLEGQPGDDRKLRFADPAGLVFELVEA